MRACGVHLADPHRFEWFGSDLAASDPDLERPAASNPVAEMLAFPVRSTPVAERLDVASIDERGRVSHTHPRPGHHLPT